MARSSKTKAKHGTPQNKGGERQSGPSGSMVGRKQQSVAELHGVQALEMEIPRNEVLSPRRSIEEL